MKLFAYCILVVCLSCSSSTQIETVIATDSVANTGTLALAENAKENGEVIFNTNNIDSLFALLQSMDAMEGELITVEVASDKFLNVSDPNGERQLSAIWMQTGIGVYEGLREQQFATVHSRLAIFEVTDTTASLIDFVNFLSSSGGLILSSDEHRPYTIAEEREAIGIHHVSGETGAGDYGFSKDEVEIYVLRHNELYKVFSTTLMDEQFSSNEMGSWAERNVNRTLTILETKTNGLFDISEYTSITENRVDEEESSTDGTSPESEETEVPQPEESAEEEPEPVIYKWNGDEYVQVD